MNYGQDYEAFGAEVKLLASDFGRRGTDTLVQQWWEALHDLSWEQFHRGMAAVKREADSFPKPIDVRREVSGERHESEAEKRAAEDRSELDEEIRVWKQDADQVERDRARFQRIRQHAAGDHKSQSDPACDSCAFELRHPHAWKHLRSGMVAGDIDWSIPVEGCCARATADPPRPVPVAAGPKRAETERGGEDDWLTEHQRELEECETRRA